MRLCTSLLNGARYNVVLHVINVNVLPNKTATKDYV